MALKFPSQSKLLYVSGGAISNDGWTQYGYLNLPKDLSIVNRRGYGSTDNKGVPWVYRCKVTTYPQDEDGFGLNLAVGSDFATTLKISVCQNNWVMRNAAIKVHAARDAMWKKAGVKKSDLGAYAGSIRYHFNGATQTWLTPIDGGGDAFTGGTWDSTMMFTESDNDGFTLKLCGAGIDETAGNEPTALAIGHSYLSSRAHVAADSNLESSEAPTKFSVINELLRPVSVSAIDDNVVVDSQDDQDNPPYEIDIDNINSDITEPVEAGRCVTGVANGISTTVVDIPFGLAGLQATHYDSADTAINTDFLTEIEVIDIYPMQG